MPSIFAANPPALTAGGVNSAQSIQPVQSAIAQAAERTGGDFDFLLAQARLESGLNADAKAKTSSAAGLFQFIGSTWLETVNEHGEEHGMGWAADAIEVRNGRATVSDPNMRSAIMQMRYDPEAASLMAGEFARDNAQHLSDEFGRQPDNTELYLAHFLGAAGATRFIGAHDANSDMIAAPLFPKAAKANQSIFYDGGRARKLSEVRDLFEAKLEKAGADGSGLGLGQAQASALAGAAGAVSSASAEFAGASSAFNPARYSEQNQTRNQTQNYAPLAAPVPLPRPPMADVLRSTFGAAGELPGRAGTHISKAYAAFERFGL